MRQREAELRAAQSLVREKEAALSQEQQRSSGERDALQGRLADKVAPRPRPRPAAMCSQGCAPARLVAERAHHSEDKPPPQALQPQSMSRLCGCPCFGRFIDRGPSVWPTSSPRRVLSGSPHARGAPPCGRATFCLSSVDEHLGGSIV